MVGPASVLQAQSCDTLGIVRPRTEVAFALCQDRSARHRDPSAPRPGLGREIAKEIDYADRFSTRLSAERHVAFITP